MYSFESSKECRRSTLIFTETALNYKSYAMLLIPELSQYSDHCSLRSLLIYWLFRLREASSDWRNKTKVPSTFKEILSSLLPWVWTTANWTLKSENLHRNSWPLFFCFCAPGKYLPQYPPWLHFDFLLMGILQRNAVLSRKMNYFRMRESDNAMAKI